MTVRRTFAFVFFVGVALGFMAPPLRAMAPERAGNLVKVPLDVDVYDEPGGEGKKRAQLLKGGSEVYLLEERADHWCNVQFDKGGTGWIWCGEGDDGQNYSVQPIAGGEGGTPHQ
jgi:hypothetical protein